MRRAIALVVLVGCSSTTARSRQNPCADGAGLEDGGCAAPPDGGLDGEATSALPPPEAGCRTVLRYPDKDHDGFGVNGETPREVCADDPRFVDNNADCADLDARAHPSQTAFFETPITGPVSGAANASSANWDFDCSGVVEEELSGTTAVCGTAGAKRPVGCGAKNFWDGAVPSCGQTAAWCNSCDHVDPNTCGCGARANLTQRCR